MTGILSPCVHVCVIDDRSGLCLGCGRDLGEIAAWAAMPAPERQRVMALLPERLATLAPAVAAG